MSKDKQRTVTFEELSKQLAQWELEKKEKEQITLPSIIMGGESVITEDKRMFFYNFSRGDIEDYIDIFRIFSLESENPKFKNVFIGLLQKKNNEMLESGVLPIECLLYASRLIGKQVDDNDELVETIADVLNALSITALGAEDKVQQALKNIVSLWDWGGQVLAVVLYVGKSGNHELIKYIMQNEVQKHITSIHKTKGKLYLLKMLLATKDAEYSREICKMLSLVGDDEVAICKEAEKYLPSGFTKQTLGEFVDVGTPRYKRLVEKITAEKVIRARGSSELSRLAGQIKRASDDRAESERLTAQFVESIASGSFSEREMQDAFYELTMTSRDTKRNFVFGDKFKEIVAPLYGSPKLIKLAYRALAHNVERNNGFEYFVAEAEEHPEYALDIYACIYISDQTRTEYAYKILDEACARELKGNDLETFQYLLNYKKNLFSEFLNRLIGLLNGDDTGRILAVFQNLKSLLDKHDSFKHIDKPVYFVFIDAVDKYMERKAELPEHVQNWCIDLVSMFKKDKTMPNEVQTMLVKIVGDSGYYDRVRSRAEAMVKRNSEADRPE